MNAPVKIVIMIAGMFVTIYITQAVLNTINTAIGQPPVGGFNATGLATSWTNNVSLLLVVPVALVGWYLLIWNKFNRLFRGNRLSAAGTTKVVSASMSCP